MRDQSVTTAPARPDTNSPSVRQSLSAVIPCYRAGDALVATVRELTAITAWNLTSTFAVDLAEVILVCDNPKIAQDHELISELAQDSRVHMIFMSTNFGQHPAPVAGIASSNADWIVTMDEDGQHDPAYIPEMLLKAIDECSSLVYAAPTNPPPHGALRNAASATTKRLFRLLTGQTTRFHSFRLMEGSVGRTVSAYVGPNVYLDVALHWVLDNPVTCPVPMREEEAGSSSYSTRKLLSHFWRMVLSSGTRPLRIVAAFGCLLAFAGLCWAIFVVIQHLLGISPAEVGWSSVITALLITTGCILVALAILAEYVGYTVKMAIGKPQYVIVDPPSNRALMIARAVVAGARR